LYLFSALKNVVGYWISKLSLERHPEGGYFVETYRSDTILNLPEYDGPRHVCTAIYYLLVGEQFSSFHEMKSDEIWHFYTGSSMKLHIIEADGTLKEVILGTNIENGETFQAIVKSGSWFAASVKDPNSYALVGCTVSPGFNCHDWKLGDRDRLAKMYPQHKLIIEKFTRPT
jgi:predicted cupin superfamily sugar epimerase